MTPAIRDALALRRINTMRVRCAKVMACQCPFCVARRSGTDPVGRLFGMLGVDPLAQAEVEALDGKAKAH